MQPSLEQALTCINRWSSFVAFERLQGSATHLSHVYFEICRGNDFGLISATRPEFSAEKNAERTAQLLLELNAAKFRSIQLLGHASIGVADTNPARAFFVVYDGENEDNDLLIAIGRKFELSAVTLSVPAIEQIRVVGLDGGVINQYLKRTMEPWHLKRVWAAMSNQKLEWLESGIITVAPLACYSVVGAVGLRSDCSENRRLFTKSPALLRDRPFRSLQEIES